MGAELLRLHHSPLGEVAPRDPGLEDEVILDPLIDLRQGKLPEGGGPWWSRFAGACQTGLMLLALAPYEGKQPFQMLALAVFPVSSGQCLALLVLHTRKVQESATLSANNSHAAIYPRHFLSRDGRA